MNKNKIPSVEGYLEGKVKRLGYDPSPVVDADDALSALQSLAADKDEEIGRQVDLFNQIETEYAKLQAEVERLRGFIDVLRENQQAQIAAYYNHDKTQEEKKVRNAVIEEYRDMILLFKTRIEPPKQ